MRTAIKAAALALALSASITGLTTQAIAQSEMKTERVTIRAGQSSAEISRSIRGRETIDFLVNAREGQRLVVSMTSNNASANFNLIAPGEQDVAFYIGSNSSPVNSFNGTVPRSGDVRIRVYLYRAAALRGERADFKVSLLVTGAASGAAQLPGTTPETGGVAGQLPADNLVPGTHYNATGNLSCQARITSRVTDCRYGVMRFGAGSAAVVISKTDGRTRTLVYRQGVPVGFDQGAQDRTRMTWSREGYLTKVRVGAEQYFVPDAIVTGG